MMLLRQLRNFFGATQSDENTTVSLGSGCSFTLPLEHAIKLRDAIAIQIIHAQDGAEYFVDTSRTTDGDME